MVLPIDSIYFTPELLLTRLADQSRLLVLHWKRSGIVVRYSLPITYKHFRIPFLLGSAILWEKMKGGGVEASGPNGDARSGRSENDSF